MPASILDTPAIKLFLKQCYSLERNLTPTSNLENKLAYKWSLLIENKKIPIGLIWVQGHIKGKKSDTNNFIVDDGSGSALIIMLPETPGYGNWISEDQYCMVLGEVITVKPVLQIRALKVTNLLNSAYEKFWNLEVLDLWTHIYINEFKK